ncbi:ribulose-phosphate 3-epimerase [Anaeramoeba ignava]|uniref:Ribulose-phosphate 3-epimerase n=1 Tax=Anaeramoeba ignava TaxID=1746090 RepID=A0A9Q0LQR6_ANAIG|nr:ribulose-phosphate 3-epimerase [Anaeramoeba ignava]
MLKPKIAPSMLSCDFSQLGEEAIRMIDSGADYLHMDVMDGHFVNNLTFGAPVVNCLNNYLQKNTKKEYVLDCHLMVSNPEKWVEDFAKSGATIFTFHIEATENPSELIEKIKSNGMKVSIAIKPKTDVSIIFPFLDKLDMVLIMTVEPGFGGQSFMKDMMKKVEILREKLPNLDIQVDGGLSPKTIDFASKAGANVIVAGTSIFKSDDPAETIQILKDSVQNNLIDKDKDKDKK